MTLITATETFDEELLEEDTAEELSELIAWLNANMQNIVATISGGITDENMSTQNIFVKATSGMKQFVGVDGDVSDVQISRVLSQPDTQSTITGYNWWAVEGGIEFVVEWKNGSNTYDVQLRVNFNV